jgi:hypothetical protein
VEMPGPVFCRYGSARIRGLLDGRKCPHPISRRNYKGPVCYTGPVRHALNAATQGVDAATQAGSYEVPPEHMSELLLPRKCSSSLTSPKRFMLLRENRGRIKIKITYHRNVKWTETSGSWCKWVRAVHSATKPSPFNPWTPTCKTGKLVGSRGRSRFGPVDCAMADMEQAELAKSRGYACTLWHQHSA